MAITLSVPKDFTELRPKITVIGAGGAGGNAVNNMIRSNLEGVDFIVANTDSQALGQSLCPVRLQLGNSITRGLGAGSRPEIGRAAAEEALDEMMEYLAGSNMVFITAGMGGGTGTGSAPVIARAARDAGILTIGVVTKPFHFEGNHRMRMAEQGIDELQQVVDTLIIIPNQNLFRIANEKTTFADAFKMADDVLCAGVRGITDLMVMPGLVNLDFADIRTVMIEMGKAMMGTGEGDGQGRALRAAEAAISNPLLDDVSMKGAKGVLINITSGYDITMYEIDEAVNRIRDEVDPLANIIFGTTFDQNMDGKVRLSIVATGIDSESVRRFPDTDGTSSDDRSGYGYNQAVRRITTPAASGNKVAATAAQAAKGAVATAPRTAEAQAVEALRQQQAATTSPAPQQAAPVFESAFTPPVAVVVPELVEAELAAAPVMYTNADIAQERAAAAGSSRGSLSFFERMTGTAGRTGRFVPEQQKPAAQPAPAAQTSAASSQTAPAKAPQDELDIPAFLRRQAN